MNKLLANIWKGAIAMAFVSCALVSCEDNPALQDIKFNLDTKEVTIPAEGGQGSFTLDAPVAWKADTPADWLVADPASGEAGNVTITLKANANETGEQRTAKVTVSSTTLSASAEVTVIQPAKKTDPTPPDPPTPPTPQAEEIPGIAAAIAAWDAGGAAAFVPESQGGTAATYTVMAIDMMAEEADEEDESSYVPYPMTEVEEGVFRATISDYKIGLVLYVLSGRTLYGVPMYYFPVLTGELELPATAVNPIFLAVLNEGTLQLDFLPSERIFRVKLI